MRDSHNVVFGAEQKRQGNILGMGIELDGIVAFIADRSAASLLEIQCASENLLGCIGQCALDIDLGIRLFADMVDVAEEVEVLVASCCINSLFLHRGLVALQFAVAVDDDILSAKFGSQEYGLCLSGKVCMSLVIDSRMRQAFFHTGNAEVCAFLQIIIRSNEAGIGRCFAFDSPYEGKLGFLAEIEYELACKVRMSFICLERNRE